MFKDRVISLAPADVDTDLPYHVMPALQTYIHFLASKHQEHYEDEGRVEEYAERGAGLDPWSDERRWGEEVENIREMSVTNLQDQIEFEKQSFKLFVEYQHFALQAAVNVRERRISLTGHPQAHGGSSHCEAPLSTRKDDSFTPTSSSALHLSSDSSNLSSSSAAAATTSSSSSPPSFENRGSVYLSHSSDTAISPAPPATILWNEVAIDLAQPLPLLGEDEEEEDRSFAEETKISSSSDHYVDDKTKKEREERRGGVTPEATDPVKMGQGREDERRTSRRDGWLHKRSHPAALSRSEVKAETHALALLDSLHIFQRPQEQREKEKDDPNAKVEREKPSNGANPRLSCKSSLSSEKKVLLNDWRITAPYSLVVDYAGSRVRCQTTQPLSLLSQGRETAGVSSQIPPDEQQGVRSERRGVGSSSQDQRGDRKTHARSSERITLERPSERTERDRDPEKEEAEEENPYLRLLQDRIGSVLGLKTTAISTAQGKKEERLLYETARCLPFPLEKKVYLLHLGRLSPVDLSEDIYSSARTATSVDAKPSSLRNSLNIREEALPSSSEDYDEDTMGPAEEKNREREKKHESSRRTRERESREAADPREVKLLRPELLSAYMQFRERREKKDFLSSTPLKKETSEDLSRHGDEAHNTTGEKEERIESEDEKKQKENKEEEERRGKTNKKKSKEGKEELASSLLSVDMKKNGTTNRHKTVKGKSPTQTSSSSSSSSSSMERDSDEPARRGSPNSRPNGGGSGLSPNSHEASLPSLYHYHPLQGEGTTATTSSLSTSTSSSSTGGASSSAEENPLEASTKHSVSHPNSSENMSQVLQSHRDKKKTRVNSDKKNRKNDMDEEYKLSSTEKMAVAPCRVEDSERNLTEDEEEEEDVFEAELRYRLELEICRRLPLLPVAFTETYTFYKSNIGLGSIFQKGSCLASGTRERIREAAEQVLVKCLEFTKSQQQAMVVEQRPDYEALRRELLLSKDERPLHSSDIKGEASLHSKEEEESERKKNTSSRKRETDGENSDRVENGGEEIRRKEEDEEEGEERKTGTKKKDEEERRGEKDIMENGVLSDTVVVVGRARGDGKKKRKNERKSTKEEEEQAICERDRGGEEKEKNGEEGIEEFLLTDEDREMMRLLGQDISLLDSSLDLSERSKQMAQQLCHFTFLSSSLSQSTEEEEGDEKEEGRRRQHPSSSPVTWTDGTSQEQLFNLNFHSSSSSFRPYRNGSAKQVLSQTKGKEEEENENESPLTSLTNGERISASSSSSSASALASSLWSTSSSPCEGGGDGDVILQEASRYLHSVAIPLLGTLLGQHLCSPPLESTSLKDLFHSFGVNLRYLGLVAKYIERHGEAKDSPIHKDDEETKEERKKKKNDFSSFLPLRILHLEMTIRSAVWCFNSFLSHLRFGHLGVATAHLLSCLLCPPDVSYPSQRYPLPSSLSSLLLRRSETRHASGVSRNKLTTTTAINHLSPSSSSSLATKSPSLSQMNDGKERRREEGDQEEEEEALRRLAYLTPDKLWRYIYERIRSHFKYTMPVDRSSSYSCLNTPAGRYVLLRGVCRAVGIQLVAGSSLFHLLGAKSLWERWSVIGCGRGKEETEKVSLPPLVCTQEEEKEERVATRAPHDEEEKEDAQEKIGEVNSSHSHHPSLDHKDTSRSPFNRREETQSTSGDREEEGDSWRSGHDDQHLLKKGERKMCCSASSSAGSVWRPLKSEDIVELFPVLKSDLVVSHLTRHLLAVATHCYVLGWLDAALELYQQVLFVIHQLSGAVC
ncbi:tetratricopeptide repeat-containing protein, partial [Cystoisospora suis]